MNISDLAQFTKDIEFTDEETGQTINIGFVSANINKGDLQYGFNIQIFDKDFYKENSDYVNSEIMKFYEDIANYLSPSKESEIVKMLAFI